MAKNKKRAGDPNPAMHLAMVGKRQSNAAGKHADKRDKRTRTRGAKKARAMKEFE